MPVIDQVLAELDERHIAQTIALPHDEARLAFRLSRNTVADFREFEVLIADYMIHHYAHCVTGGGRLSRIDALGKGKAALERENRRRHGDLLSSFSDANLGLNGGAMGVLNVLCEAIKSEAIEHHVRNVFDHFVAPNDFEAKVRLIEEFINHCGHYLSSSIDRTRPERYAHDYRTLVEAYVEGLRDTSAMFRRL